MRVLYFARLRQIIGRSEEDIELPEAVGTVAELIDWLKTRDDSHAAAFADPRIVRAAVDHAHAPLDAPIKAAREVAFFPPVTGG